MSTIRLLFEGHLAEAIGPYAFKILEPFHFDADKWSDDNILSGYYLYTREGLLMYFTTGDYGDIYLYGNLKKYGMDKFASYQTCRNAGCISGFMEIEGWS